MTRQDALRKAIKKWRKVLVDENVNDEHGVRDCALCKLYYAAVVYKKHGIVQCHGCPIREDTGKPACEGTPYEQWFDEKIFIRSRGDVWSAQAQRFAEQEVKYLEALYKRLYGARV